MTDPKKTAVLLIALYREALSKIAEHKAGPAPAEYAESVLEAGEREISR